MTATRFYLPSSGTAPASPAYGSSWEDTSGATRRPLVTTATNTSIAATVLTPPLVAAPVDSLAGQWTSDVLPAGPISGTFTLVVHAAATDAGNMFLQARISVVSGDGSTERGVLYSGQTATVQSATSTDPNYEWPNGSSESSSRTRLLAAVSVSSVTAQAGDRIVVEVGTRCINPNGTNRTTTFRFGDPTARSDFAATVDLDGTTGRDWIEFSQDLFAGPTTSTVTLAGTLQAKTAAFTVATVLAASLAGTVQAKTAAFTIDLPAAPDRVVTLAGQLQAKTAAFAVLGPLDATLSGTLQAKSVAFSLSAGATASLAGTLQSKTAAFEIESTKTLTLAGSLRRKTSSITLVGSPLLRLAATQRAKTASFNVEARQSAQLVGELQPKIASFSAYAVAPVVLSPFIGPQAVVVARAFGLVTMNGTQPVYTVSSAVAERARLRLVVDGVDRTYFRGVTPIVDYTLLEPLLYGPGSIEFPQIAACFEQEGEGDLSWLRAQAQVEIHRVIDDVVVGIDYKGFVAAFDKSGRNLTVELGGEANGRMAMRDRQPVRFPRINDVGHQMADSVRDIGLLHHPPLGAVTGIEVMTTGGMGHLEHFEGLSAKAWTLSGRQWVTMPDESTGVYETHRKDDETIHGTVFLDDAKTVGNLRRDIAEEPNQIFVTCVTPAGMRVLFGKYPGLIQGPVPDFPGSMFLGSEGEGVRLLVGKLHATGYLKLGDVVGGYDDDVVRAVIALQNDAGLAETGEVNEQTWNALYDLDVTGMSLEWATIQPAAQRSKTRKFDRSASGTIMGFNEDYDPNVIVRHRTIDLGSGVTRGQAREYAKAVLHDSDDPNWIGDITFHTGALVRGEKTEGAVLTSADAMDARELRPGMNLLLPQFDGGTLVHIAACQVNRDGLVTATVDTRFRNAMEVWDVIARNKESRNDPSRRRNRKHRSSTIQKDSIVEYDEVGGILGDDITLEPGHWTEFQVVAAMEGTISRFLLTLGTPAEFAVAVFGRPGGANLLNDINPNPLTTLGERVWRRRATRDRLKDRWLLYSAGTEDEPCGYGSDVKSDDAELTGEHDDDASFAYRSDDRTRIWVAVWVEDDNTIPIPEPHGRIMWPQLEAGV